MGDGSPSDVWVHVAIDIATGHVTMEAFPSVKFQLYSYFPNSTLGDTTPSPLFKEKYRISIILSYLKENFSATLSHRNFVTIHDTSAELKCR